MNPVEVMSDILKFKGFWSAPLNEKLKWLFILYPFFVFVVIYYSGNWILFLYEKHIWNPIKKHWKITYLVLFLIILLPMVIRLFIALHAKG